MTSINPTHHNAASASAKIESTDSPPRGLIAVLAALAAIGSLSTNVILPAFPAIAHSLNVSTQQLGLTLSTFFLVFGVGQLLVGPLSDRYGRRKLVIGGLLIFAAGSIVCSMAADIQILVLGRAIQAAGVCAASVLARAIARDLFEKETLAKVLAMVIVAMAAAPGFSPLLGSLAERWLGWRMMFLVVGALGLLLAIWYGLKVGESHPPRRRAPLALGAVVKAYWGLLLDGRFIAPAAVIAFLTGGLYAFFTAAPTILMGAFGFTSLQLGFFFAGIVLVVFAAGITAPRLAKRWGAPRVTQAGMIVAIVGGILVYASSHSSMTSMTGVASFTVAICVFLLGIGTANPLSTALALSPFGAQAGAASALLGFLQMIGAAIGATLVSRSGVATQIVTLAAVLICCQILGVVIFALRPGIAKSARA